MALLNELATCIQPHRIRKAALIFNPNSGMRPQRRGRDLRLAERLFAEAGVENFVVASESPESAAEHAANAARNGFDTVIACGGDGTVHMVLQGILAAGVDVALGVIPLGCGNLLAKELHIPRETAASIHALLEATAVRFPVPEIEYVGKDGESNRRYWGVAAGIGADAQVICKIDPLQKSRFGIYAYYKESTRQLLLTRDPFTPFQLEFRESESNTWRREIVTQAVVARVTYFANALTNVQTGDGLSAPDLQLILFKTSSRWRYLQYGSKLVGRMLGGTPGTVPGVELVRASEILCRPMPASGNGHSAFAGKQVLAETDGELLGTLPVRLWLGERTIRLVRPLGTA